jgi:hypothetical protein
MILLNPKEVGKRKIEDEAEDEAWNVGVDEAEEEEEEEVVHEGEGFRVDPSTMRVRPRDRIRIIRTSQL